MEITKPFTQKINITPYSIDREYLRLCQQILNEGFLQENRTGTKTYVTTGLSIRHDMALGFPILSTKKVAWKTLKVELEGFLKGVISKKWYQERGCHIWDEWCSPVKVPYGHDEETKRKMKDENDLGPIYGYQWSSFNDDTSNGNQLEYVLNSLKNKPDDRRMLVSAYNPLQLGEMALPPCHFAWQVCVIGDRLDLVYYIRSNDFGLGAPFNIASYGLLLHLLAQQFGYKEGILTGHIGNAHIYENHIEGLSEQMKREPRGPVKIETQLFDDIRNWDHTMTKLINYDPHPAIKMDVAV